MGQQVFGSYSIVIQPRGKGVRRPKGHQKRVFGSLRRLQIYFFCNQNVELGALFSGAGERAGILISCYGSMSHFTKERNCPSSFDLAALVTVGLPGDQGLTIAVHVRQCEFCAAEVDLYSHYPPSQPSLPETDPMPKPLFELAEALLGSETIHISRLEHLLNITERRRKQRRVALS